MTKNVQKVYTKKKFNSVAYLPPPIYIHEDYGEKISKLNKEDAKDLDDFVQLFIITAMERWLEMYDRNQ